MVYSINGMSVRCWLSLSLLWVLCKNCQVRVFEKIVEFCWSFQTIFLSFVFKHFQNNLILRRYIGLILNRQIIFHFRYYVNRGSFINEWFLVLQTNHQPHINFVASGHCFRLFQCCWLFAFFSLLCKSTDWFLYYGNIDR